MAVLYLDTIPMVIGNVQNDRSCLPMSNIVSCHYFASITTEMQYWSIKAEVLKNVVNHLQKSGLFLLYTTVTRKVTVKECNVSLFCQL